MLKPSMSRMTIWLCALLAGVALWAAGLLLMRLKPYCVAKYWGAFAKLDGAALSLAPLAGADLRLAHLNRAHLRAADLRGTNMMGAELRAADLASANLQGADLLVTDFTGANLSHGVLARAYML